MSFCKNDFQMKIKRLNNSNYEIFTVKIRFFAGETMNSSLKEKCKYYPYHLKNWLLKFYTTKIYTNDEPQDRGWCQ